MPHKMPSARLVTLSLVLAAALGGCHAQSFENNPVEVAINHTFDWANWRQRPAHVHNMVEPITMVYPVEFADGQASLSDSELSGLVDFLNQSGAGDGARVEVDGPRLDGGYYDALTSARLSEVQDTLSHLGLAGEVPDQPVDMLTKPNGAVVVMVTQTKVVLPDCSVPQPAYAERPGYTFSCTTAATLGMMVADPLDLERGRAAGTADGERSTLSIQRYRTDKIKQPTSESTSE